MVKLLNKMLLLLGYKIVAIEHNDYDNTNLTDNIPYDIRKEIDSLGLRQDFIAKKLKISNAYLTMLIKGQRTNKDKINAIINYLKKRSNEAA